MIPKHFAALGAALPLALVLSCSGESGSTGQEGTPVSTDPPENAAAAPLAPPMTEMPAAGESEATPPAPPGEGATESPMPPAAMPPAAMPPAAMPPDETPAEETPLPPAGLPEPTPPVPAPPPPEAVQPQAPDEQPEGMGGQGGAPAPAEPEAGGSGGAGGAGGAPGEASGGQAGEPNVAPEEPVVAEPSLFDAAYDIFVAKCSGMNCHGDDDVSRPQISATDRELAETDSVNNGPDIVRSITRAKGTRRFMPKNGEPLSAEEIAVIVEWADSL